MCFPHLPNAMNELTPISEIDESGTTVILLQLLLKHGKPDFVQNMLQIE